MEPSIAEQLRSRIISILRSTHSAPDAATQILEEVAKAVLSDEAVDALLIKTYGWYDYEKGLWYDDAPETEKEAARNCERFGLANMLVALGVPEERWILDYV